MPIQLSDESCKRSVVSWGHGLNFNSKQILNKFSSGVEFKPRESIQVHNEKINSLSNEEKNKREQLQGLQQQTPKFASSKALNYGGSFLSRSSADSREPSAPSNSQIEEIVEEDKLEEVKSEDDNG